MVGGADDMEAAVARHSPELIVCPMLKQRIPKSIWSTRRCLVVHPGPTGDRGPSSLDWAIELGASDWGVTDNNRQARYCRHTPAGRRALGKEVDSWKKFAAALDAALRTT